MSAQRGERAVTRDDVARRAGTSTAVVSYVMNDGPRPVAAATRARVLAAIADLGYRPNALARALRARHSNALGLVVSDISNPFLGELVRSIEVAAFERGYTVLLGNTMVETERERDYLRHFIDRQADGLLIVPVGMDRATVDELNSGAIPVVVLDRPVPYLRATTFLVDNAGGARQVTAHLVQHGHTRIGCLGGPPALVPATRRLEGWSQAIAEAGLDSSACPVARASVGRRAGHDAAIDLLADRRTRPTAVFATTDEQAIGVLRAAADLGLRVPEDLAVAGFDGIAQGAFCVPGLTTAQQPIEEMANRAVKALMDGTAGGPPRPRTETLPVELVRRGSCGCPDTPPTDT
jgi:LacI family transcriptional regulator, galactose operon repressor